MKIPDIAEQRAIKLFTKEFGTDLLVRHNKFMEEVSELNQAFHEYRLEPTPERLQHLLDEYSDVQGTFTHLASLIGLYQREMLHNCIDKVKGRKIDPNYKRFDKYPYTIKRTTTNVTGHLKAVPVSYTEDLGWIMPDPKFYSTIEDIIDAWRRYYEDRLSVKMVKCNEQGIQTENYKDSDEYRKNLLSEGNSKENPIQPIQLI